MGVELDPAIDETPSDRELAHGLAQAVDVDEETAMDVIVALHGASSELEARRQRDSFARQLKHRLAQATLKRS